MYSADSPNVKTYIPLALVISPGLLWGLLHLFGPMPPAAIASLLAIGIIIAVVGKSFHWFSLMSVTLLFCVFIEPAPTDLILSIIIPIGLLSGRYKPQIEAKSLFVIAVLLAYFVVSLPGIAFSYDQFEALRYYFITLYLFVMSVFIGTYPNRSNIDSVLRAYILAAFLSSAAGITGYAGYYTQLLMPDGYRIQGLFKDPNVFGPFFVPAIIILADDIMRKKVLRCHAAIHIFLIILFTLCVIFSFSRAAYINLFISLFIYFSLNIRKFLSVKSFRAIIILFAIFFMVFCILISPLTDEAGIADFLKHRAKIQSYDSNRFKGQLGGLELVVQNPLGYGPGQFESVIIRVTKYELSAHSLYIRVLTENGILGFLFFFASLGYLTVQLFLCHLRAKRYEEENSDAFNVSLYPSVIIALLCGLLINGSVVDTIHWRHFWFVIGLGLYCLRELREETAAYERKKRETLHTS